MSYFKERIPKLIDKIKLNIIYLESIIESSSEEELGGEKVLNVIRAKKEAREELMKCYNEVERLESIHSGKDQEKDTTNLHPTKRFASQ
jgi:hypothetical protein